MGVPIVICGCGKRLRVSGESTVRVGRCPRCGRELAVPDAPGLDRSGHVAEEEPGAGGYAVRPVGRSPGQGPQGARPISEHPTRASIDAPPRRPPTSDGLLPVLERPETWWLPCVVYPLRGAESLGVIAVLGVAFWILTILVPEYCLTAIRDGAMLGALSMGRLVALISALPAMILLPLVSSYGLQYLGRVLGSSARGETAPPRLPDRNFEGLFSGLGPWLVWLVAGLAACLVPIALYGLSRGRDGAWDWRIALGLALLGLPYALMALPLAFLDDDALSASPRRVLGALARANLSFLPLCAVVATALGLVATAFAAALALRASHFWLYLLACLVCWFLACWTAIVVMRLLGNFFYRRRKILCWQRKRPRQSISTTPRGRPPGP